MTTSRAVRGIPIEVYLKAEKQRTTSPGRTLLCGQNKLGVSMFDEIRLVRTLEPAFLFEGSVFAWQCSLCKKLFVPSLASATAGGESSDRSTTSQLLQHDFHRHSCSLHFSTVLERYERQHRAAR